MTRNIPSLITFTPAIRNYIWGGHNLRSLAGSSAEDGDNPIAEIWAVHEDNAVNSGIFVGHTLAELTAEYPEKILGMQAKSWSDKRFPLLIKLLDCERWLSLQVHPNDKQAQQLEGLNFRGKTEAWYILSAQPDARLIAGVKPNTTIDALHAAIGNEAIIELVEYHHVKAGDTIFMPAGTIHALGPGLLVYEVQQTSDLTYRVFDWNRPQINGRVLHIEKSIAVADLHSQGQITRQQNFDGGTISLVQCPYFRLEMLSAPQERDTKGESFHALTVVSGEAQVITQKSRASLGKYNTVFVPAICGKYRLEGSFQILCSSISDQT